ncbi:hypothetical protein [Granulicella sibirica]|uniref:Uncharacterized protein n=1 Tax=Granulicella sibirica TaxID=2479048 RepID=A0A4Q0T1Y4_9BACT|nr:hypothetical protein [Granulicella sibirica]RXH56822.1 hypothetical protein GRAN_0132 [Granulicella sibirica]
MPRAVTHEAFGTSLRQPNTAGERAQDADLFSRRRASRQQGIALEKLAHAVEYLIDSRMFLTQAPYTKSEEEAVKMLMRLNRAVFESCPVIVPLGTRVREWVRQAVGAEPKAA